MPPPPPAFKVLADKTFVRKGGAEWVICQLHSVDNIPVNPIRIYDSDAGGNVAQEMTCFGFAPVEEPRRHPLTSKVRFDAQDMISQSILVDVAILKQILADIGFESIGKTVVLKGYWVYGRGRDALDETLSEFVYPLELAVQPAARDDTPLVLAFRQKDGTWAEADDHHSTISVLEPDLGRIAPFIAVKAQSQSSRFSGLQTGTCHVRLTFHTASQRDQSSLLVRERKSGQAAETALLLADLYQSPDKDDGRGFTREWSFLVYVDEVYEIGLPVFRIDGDTCRDLVENFIADGELRPLRYEIVAQKSRSVPLAGAITPVLPDGTKAAPEALKDWVRFVSQDLQTVQTRPLTATPRLPLEFSFPPSQQDVLILVWPVLPSVTLPRLILSGTSRYGRVNSLSERLKQIELEAKTHNANRVSMKLGLDPYPEFELSLLFNKVVDYTCLAIDVGSASVAAAIVGRSARPQLDPSSTADEPQMLAIARLFDDGPLPDPARGDAGNGLLVPSATALVTKTGNGPRQLPWYLWSMHDTRFLDLERDQPQVAKGTTFEDITRRSQEFPGSCRQVELHFPIMPASMAEDPDRFDLVLLADPKMMLCQVPADQMDVSFTGKSHPQGVPTEVIVGHLVDIVASVLVPHAPSLNPKIQKTMGYEWLETWRPGVQRKLSIALSHPASIGNAALTRYQNALNQAVKLIESQKHIVPGIVDEVEIITETVPEALAVVEFIRPHLMTMQAGQGAAERKPRRLIVIDIGAGTTDVAVADFRSGQAQSEIRSSFAVPVAAKVFMDLVGQCIAGLPCDFDIKAIPDAERQTLAIVPGEKPLRLAARKAIDQAIREMTRPDRISVFLNIGRPRPPVPPLGQGDLIHRLADQDPVQVWAVLDLASRTRFNAPLLTAIDRFSALLMGALATILSQSDDSAMPIVPAQSCAIVLSGRGALFPGLRASLASAAKERGLGPVETIADIIARSKVPAAASLALDHATMMKSVVALGTAAIARDRCLSLRTDCDRFDEDTLVLVLGKLTEDKQNFSTIHEVGVMTADRGWIACPSHLRHLKFYLARTVPGIDVARLARDFAAGQSPEQHLIDRAFIRPLRVLESADPVMTWTVEGDRVVLSTSSEPQLHSRFLRGDGSYL